MRRTQNTLYTGIAVLGLIIIATLMLFYSSTIPQIFLVATLAFLIGLLSFIRQDIAGIALIISMLLSPEINLGGNLAHREISIRLDDVLLMTFFFSWFFKVAFYKNLPFLTLTPLNAPIGAYIIVAMLASWRGVVSGDIHGLAWIFYLLKYVEYFMIFFMFSNIIKTPGQLRRYLIAFFTTAAIICAYGLIQIYMGVSRISTPFEGPGGEANTFGGYLIIIFSLVFTLYIQSTDFRYKTPLLIATITIIFLIERTYSRASYLGLIAAIFGISLFLKPIYKITLLLLFITTIAFRPLIVPLLPETFRERVNAPFEGEEKSTIFPGVQINIYDSSYMKIQSAKSAIRFWTESPLLGKGVTAVGLVDIQFPRTLGETGILGILCYLWIFYAIWRAIRHTLTAISLYPTRTTRLYWAITAGYAGALIGLLVHSLGANTFIIVRIMEPFWFLTAVVVSIPDILENTNAQNPEDNPGNPGTKPNHPVYRITR